MNFLWIFLIVLSLASVAAEALPTIVRIIGAVILVLVVGYFLFGLMFLGFGVFIPFLL